MSESLFRVHDIGIDVFDGSDDFLQDWRSRWGAAIQDFQDIGCGCCVHVLSFVGPKAAILELESRFNEEIWHKAVD